jgi:hypothetical protein
MLKVKIKLSLCLTIHNAMKMYWESGGIAPHTHSLSTRWGLVTFMPWLLYPWGKIPGTHSIGGWVGPRAGLDTVAKIKNPIITPARN